MALIFGWVTNSLSVFQMTNSETLSKVSQTLFKMLESRALFFGIGVVFRFLLEISYRDFVHPVFEYAGFEMQPNFDKYIESWIMYIGALILIPEKVSRPSHYIICIMFFVFIAPLLVYYGFADPDRWALYCVMTQYLIMILVSKGRLVHVPVIRNGPALALGLNVLTVGVATAWMVASVGVSNFNLDLDAVYDFREEANNQIYSGALGYIAVWAATVSGPFILMLFLRRKNYMLAFGVFVLHAFWFSINTHKAVLFYPVLVVSIYILFKYSRATSIIPLTFSAVVALCLVDYFFTGSLFLSGMFIRRLFFVPSHLTFVYFDFFDDNPLVYWSNSFFTWFLNYPYNESIALVIGSYLGDSTLWANNSFFSTGYMHAGLLGIVLYGVVVGLILRILDSLASKGIPLWGSLAITIVPFNNLATSADLPTTLLTHGLGYSIFVLYLYRAGRCLKVNNTTLKIC